EADRLPTSWVLGPVASAGDLVRTKLAAIGPVARAADALVRSIPSFAGSAGRRRYFVAIQNTAELRGTGGFIGNYAILSIARGRVKLSPFADSSALPDLPVRAIPPPSPQYARLYNASAGAGLWLNLNMTPDDPPAARAIDP